jgi:multiple sugar transport system ATP-binding protein
VTHDQVEAMAMADSITVMNLGKIMQVGRPMEVYEKPANLFVAGFLGSPPMSFLHAERSNGTIRSANITLKLDEGKTKAIAEGATGSKVVVGVRPEDVHIVPTTSDDSSARAEVYAVEPLGDETLIDLRLGDDQIRARLGPTSTFRPGDIVSITLDPNKLHVFDSQSEQALT